MRLIDFDRSGKKDEAPRYPLHLLKCVQWAGETEELELEFIRDHDLIMLDNLFTPPLSSDPLVDIWSMYSAPHLYP